MTTAISVERKSRGRPRVGATTVGVRYPPDQLAAIDSWIEKQPDPQPNRPEAIRRLTALGLKI